MMIQLTSIASLTLVIASILFHATTTFASPIQLLDFQEVAQAAFGSLVPAVVPKSQHYACPEHDKTGWALSFLPLSPGAYYPYRRPMSNRLIMNRGIRVRTNRTDRTVDIIENEVEEQMGCLYPINTSDSSSLCFYSKISGGLVEDRNRGNCASKAVLVTET